MKENLAVYDMELSEEDMQAIDELRNTDEAKKFLMMDSNTWEKVEK
jgi:diketogulonate reductase-like aldo/keto reductase